MSKRFKIIVLILMLVILVSGSINIFLDAKHNKEKEQKIDENKIATKEDYEIIRNNNKYTLKTNKLADKKLKKIFYDDRNVYLYYDGEDNATLLKYNIKNNKVVILYENDKTIHNDFKKIGNYYKLGNKIFDSNFKQIMDYPVIDEGGLLLPNLENELVSKDGNLVVRNIKNKTENVVLEKKENDSYSPYSIKTDGKYILAVKTVNEEQYLVVLDHDYNVINVFNDDRNIYSKNYTLLDDVPYLLESVGSDNNIIYNIYNARDMSVVYKSVDDKDCFNFIFENTKYVCNDKKGNIILTDYISKEVRTLVNRDKKVIAPSNFLMSSDSFSLVLTLNNDDMSFYVFYL